jgi:hypothetical protein
MKIKAIINEMTFGMYQGLIRVSHNDEISASEVADFVRAMPGVTRVTAVDSNEDTNTVVLKVKILTGKPGPVVFEKLKKDTFKLVPNIKKVDLSLKSVEKIK